MSVCQGFAECGSLEHQDESLFSVCCLGKEDKSITTQHVTSGKIARQTCDFAIELGYRVHSTCQAASCPQPFLDSSLATSVFIRTSRLTYIAVVFTVVVCRELSVESSQGQYACSVAFGTVDGKYFASFSQSFRTSNISMHQPPLAPPSSMLGSRTTSQAPRGGGLSGQNFASPIPPVYTTLNLEGMGDQGGVAEQTVGA